MNLLAKRGKWWLLAMLITVWGCKEDLGIEVEPGQGRTEGTSVELTLPVSNVFYDSVRTDKTGILLAGEYSDGEFGSLVGSSYFEYNFKSGLTSLSQAWIPKSLEDSEGNIINYADSLDDLTFDGALLRLRLNNVLASTNLVNNEFVVHTLLDSIYDKAVYLNTRSIETDEEIGREVVSLDLDMVDFQSDTLTVELDVTSTAIENVFKRLLNDGLSNRELGLKVSSDMSNSLWSFVAEDDTTELQITIRGNVYDTAGIATIRTDTTFTTVFSISGTRHFVNIQRERSGTPLEGLQHGDEFQLNEDEVVYFPLAGVLPAVEVSPYRDFAILEQTLIANLGEISISKNENSEYVPYVKQTRAYFGSSNEDKVHVNWPGALTNQGIFSTALLTDDSYAGSGSIALLAMANDTLEMSPLTLGFRGEFTAFWQNLHKNTIDEFLGVDEEDRRFPSSELTNLDRLVLYPSTTLDIGKSSIPSEGVNLKILYTKIKD